MNILFVNACVHPESRTKKLADYFLSKIDGNIKEVNLNNEKIPPLNKETLMFRTKLTEEMNFDEAIFKYAHDYANADMIVIAAPYWDLSFPSALKIYIENINVNGIVFNYDENGNVIGLCNAQRLVYITTSGGKISHEYGFEYIKSLAQDFHGIKDINYIKAEELDIVGSDVEKILHKTEEKIDKLVKKEFKE
jgi:FMN-dependent NADH-azoreductase